MKERTLPSKYFQNKSQKQNYEKNIEPLMKGYLHLDDK